MAIVPRKRARSTVYFVVTKGHWERVGSDRREAERLDARRKREVKAGTYKPGGGTGKQTVRAYGEKWLDGRKVKAAATEAQLVRDYVLSTDFAELRVEDVRPRHVLALIERLRVAVPVSGRSPTLSGKTVANIVGVLKTMFRDAVIGEAAAANPVVVPRGTLSRKGARRQSYELDAARAVLAGARRPEARVFAALALYTGMREGEVCGRRWRDLDGKCSPLASFTVATQYEDEPLKTDRPRRVPVHPELDAILVQWMHGGWELVYRRKPTADDFIVPPPRTPDRCYTKSGAYQLWRQLLRETGVTNLSLHSTRHTFLTLARRGGAREEVIEQVTHNARGSMVDQYTHWDWAPLCEAVMCLPSLLQGLPNRPDEVSGGTLAAGSDDSERRDAGATSGITGCEPGPDHGGALPGTGGTTAVKERIKEKLAARRAERARHVAGAGPTAAAPDADEAPDNTERTETERDAFLAGRLTDNADERPFRLQRLDSNLGTTPKQPAQDSTSGTDTGQASSENPAGLLRDGAGLAAGQVPTCRHQDYIDDEGYALGAHCGEPAEWLSCVPYIDTATCEMHKCRCARPIRNGGDAPDRAGTRHVPVEVTPAGPDAGSGPADANLTPGVQSTISSAPAATKPACPRCGDGGIEDVYGTECRDCTPKRPHSPAAWALAAMAARLGILT